MGVYVGVFSHLSATRVSARRCGVGFKVMCKEGTSILCRTFQECQALDCKEPSECQYCCSAHDKIQVQGNIYRICEIQTGRNNVSSDSDSEPL